MNLTEATKALTNILDLNRAPVALKFCEGKAHLDGFRMASERRYCQVLMAAGQGERLMLTSDNISCPAAAWALGFKEPPAMLRSGDMPAAMGIFRSPAAAAHTLNTMPRLEMGKYAMVACCPLDAAPFEPDVVVMEAVAERLMWVALASVFGTGGRIDLSTAILQATCVDVTILPFLTQKLNASLGCYGCREATDLAEGECVLGFPFKDLENIVTALRELTEKAIPRVRGKAIYAALLNRA